MKSKKKKKEETPVNETEAINDTSAEDEFRPEKECEAPITDDVPEMLEITSCEYNQLKTERDELQDKMLRVAADFENYKKRVAKDRAIAEISASKNAMRNILLILSSVNRGIDSSEGQDCTGLQVIKDQIHSILDAEGVSVIKTTGEKFDPEIHEALFMEENPDVPDKTILEEIEIGYAFRGTVLAPAKVKVSKLPEPPSDENEEASGEDESGEVENQE